jgi:hypothetical protein
MEIINKVANSGLITLDLEEYYLPGDRVLFDMKDWLFQELILKEKDFRDKLKIYDWSQYKDKFVAITCTADAIVPTWAFMLVASQLNGIAKKIIFGNLEKLEEDVFFESISKISPTDFKDQKVIIKGCSKIDVPVSVYVKITDMLRPFVKSIMYGEPCSTVPVFKRKE